MTRRGPARAARGGRPRARRSLGLFAVVVLTAGWSPAAALAHSLVRIEGGELRYLSVDATSLNDLTITQSASTFKIKDPRVDGGIDPGPCIPITESEVDCPVSGIRSVRADLGALDDKGVLRISLPSVMLGGPGNDVLTSGSGDDTMTGEDGNDTLAGGAGNDTIAAGDGEDSLAGGDGNDVLHGGAAVDSFDAGAGDDQLRSRDGAADRLACGAGADSVAGDEQDQLSQDQAQLCEQVERAGGELPPPSGTEAPKDRTPPLVRLGGPTIQRPLRRRAVVVAATAGEAGSVTARGSITARGRRYRLRAATRRVSVAGAGVELRLTILRSETGALRRALRRGGAIARVSVTARDGKGNRSYPITRVIRLRA